MCNRHGDPTRYVLVVTQYVASTFYPSMVEYYNLYHIVIGITISSYTIIAIVRDIIIIIIIIIIVDINFIFMKLIMISLI